ncbi:hypothetical protein J6590_057876 [Homalodisca vitripennis]|nr:hypothetical protein J6590_057876 [Homalodisca vitripennis]
MRVPTSIKKRRKCTHDAKTLVKVHLRPVYVTLTLPPVSTVDSKITNISNPINQSKYAPSVRIDDSQITQHIKSNQPKYAPSVRIDDSQITQHIKSNHRSLQVAGLQVWLREKNAPSVRIDDSQITQNIKYNEPLPPSSWVTSMAKRVKMPLQTA